VSAAHRDLEPDFENILQRCYKKWRNNFVNYKQTAATGYDNFTKNVNKNCANLLDYVIRIYDVNIK